MEAFQVLSLNAAVLIEDNVVVLEIASGVKIRIDKNSIYANAAATQQTK